MCERMLARRPIGKLTRREQRQRLALCACQALRCLGSPCHCKGMPDYVVSRVVCVGWAWGVCVLLSFPL